MPDTGSARVETEGPRGSIARGPPGFPRERDGSAGDAGGSLQENSRGVEREGHRDDGISILLPRFPASCCCSIGYCSLSDRTRGVTAGGSREAPHKAAAGPHPRR
ncbi:hypothetical protein GW17_00032484 [Ensete ventricosum]|nr:hypothetical protein GW17_00032484 [Ensete ventricosum]